MFTWSFLAIQTDSVVEFNINAENKVESESEDERKDWSKSPVPPTPKKEQKLTAGRLNMS